MLKQEQVEILESINDYISNILNTMPSIVKAYRISDLAKINEYSIPLVEGFEWLNEALTITNYIHDIDMVQIKDIFAELIESLEYKDHVLTADLFEFEIVPKFEEWRKRISDIIELNR